MRPRTAIAAVIVIVATTAAILLSMGREPICKCGLWLAARRWPIGARLIAATISDRADFRFVVDFSKSEIGD